MNQAQLIALLDATEAHLTTVLGDHDGAAIVYAESGWTVRHVLAHLTAWEHEAAASLEAHAQGAGYHIPAFTSGEAYNQQQHQERAALSWDEVRTQWLAAHARLRAVLGELGEHRLHTALLYPWGARGDAVELIQDMVSHERAHCRDIASALKPT